MSSVMLVGAFGQGNPGDEALCSAFVDALRDHDVVVASGDPRRHLAAACRARDPRARRGPRHASCAASMRSSSVAAPCSSRSTHPAGAARTRSFGTPPRSSPAPEPPGRRWRWSASAPATCATDGPRRWARWLVRQSDLVVLRDEESAALLADAGVPAPFWIGADPAFTLRSAVDPADAIEQRPPSVTVALSHLAGDDRLLDDLAGAIAPLRDDHDIRLQPWQTGGDQRDGVLADALERSARRRGARSSSRRSTSLTPPQRSPATGSSSGCDSTRSSPLPRRERGSSPWPTSPSSPDWRAASTRCRCRLTHRRRCSRPPCDRRSRPNRRRRRPGPTRSPGRAARST